MEVVCVSVRTHLNESPNFIVSYLRQKEMYMSDAKNIKALENSSVELTLTLPAARIEEDYQKSLAKYVKNAQIPGFRKGHVPASVLEK